MSGGLDSTSLAALAVKRCQREITSFTFFYDRLFKDPERYYAGLAAQAIGLSPHYIPVDDYPIYERYKTLITADPYDIPFQGMWFELGKTMAAQKLHVILSGDLGDDLLVRTLAAELIGAIPIGRLALDLLRCLLVHRLPPGLGIRYKI